MFGNTSECVAIAQEVLDKAGYEVILFQTTGHGGEIHSSQRMSTPPSPDLETSLAQIAVD